MMKWGWDCMDEEVGVSGGEASGGRLEPRYGYD